MVERAFLPARLALFHLLTIRGTMFQLFFHCQVQESRNVVSGKGMNDKILW